MSYSAGEPLYLSVADAVTRLGDSGKYLLLQAHGAGKLTLWGRRQKGSWSSDDYEQILPKIFIDYDPPTCAVRLNLTENTIEADANTADFEAFERNEKQRWVAVRVATHEILRLSVAVMGEAHTTAILAPRPSGVPKTAPKRDVLRRAVQTRLHRGEMPGRNSPWKTFCDNVRDDCDGWSKGRKPMRGYGDKTIGRIVKDLHTPSQTTSDI